jgi:hypothetical protein
MAGEVKPMKTEQQAVMNGIASLYATLGDLANRVRAGTALDAPEALVDDLAEAESNLQEHLAEAPPEVKRVKRGRRSGGRRFNRRDGE